MIKELVRLASHLDAKGLRREADYLDGIISRAGIGTLRSRARGFLRKELASAGTGVVDASAAARRACVEFREDWEGLKSLFGAGGSVDWSEELKSTAEQLLIAMNEQGCTAIPELTFKEDAGTPEEKEQPSAGTPPPSSEQQQQPKEVSPNWMNRQ